MKKGTVTGEVKSILNELGIKYHLVFSDKYGENRVGVKVCEVYLTENQKQVVRTKMEQKGFIYQFIKENRQSGWNLFRGTRFCFIKK